MVLATHFMVGCELTSHHWSDRRIYDLHLQMFDTLRGHNALYFLKHKDLEPLNLSFEDE